MRFSWQSVVLKASCRCTKACRNGFPAWSDGSRGSKADGPGPSQSLPGCSAGPTGGESAPDWWSLRCSLWEFGLFAWTHIFLAATSWCTFRHSLAMGLLQSGVDSTNPRQQKWEEHFEIGGAITPAFKNARFPRYVRSARRAFA